MCVCGRKRASERASEREREREREIEREREREREVGGGGGVGVGVLWIVLLPADASFDSPVIAVSPHRCVSIVLIHKD